MSDTKIIADNYERALASERRMIARDAQGRARLLAEKIACSPLGAAVFERIADSAGDRDAIFAAHVHDLAEAFLTEGARRGAEAERESR